MSAIVNRLAVVDYARRKQGIPTTAVERGEPSKAELREMLTQAVVNTSKDKVVKA